MTPHDLEEAIRKANKLVEGGGSVAFATFRMVKTLLQHEADKEAERCLAAFQANRLQNELISQEK